MQTTAIRNFKTHPAQMRTIHDIGKLAELTLQIYERGLNEWQPIVASPNPGLSRAEAGDGVYIVSGHRRHMAKLLCFALESWSKDHNDTEITVEVVEVMISALIEKLGSLDELVTSLKEKYGDAEIPYVPFDGDEKAQTLALQAANYGGEQADPLGVAFSFRKAMEAGATPEEIARNAGQKVNYVTNHLALANISPELAQRIAAGDLPMSVGTAVAELPEPKKTGLTIFILANEKITAKDVKSCAGVLKKWNGLHMPMMFKHQSQKNIARALVRLWSQVVEAYPEDAYAAASMLIFRGLHDEPWAAQEKLTLWFQTLGGDTYFTDGSVNWAAIVQYLITEVTCETCPINQLPKEQLQSDLSAGQGGPLGMPCRVAPSAGSGQAPSTKQGAMRCIHGLAPNDAVDVRVPMDWGGNTGVVSNSGDYRVKSYEDLLAAWEAQKAKEVAEAQAQAVAEAAPQAEVEKPTAAKAVASEGTINTPSKAQKPKAQPAKDSPIAKQRSITAKYMKHHEQFSERQGLAHHPFATSCASCRHKLDKSPTKDESVPHCAWAGRLRGVEYKQLHSDLEGAPEILVCRQYAPSQPWTELIPEHPEPSGMSRAWIKAQVLHLVKAANNHGSKRNAFEFLTGRPMGANESHSDWFARQLDEHIGELSDAQLFTLMVWAFTEWQRAKSSTFSLPVNRSGLQFADFSECKWEPD